MNCMVQSARKNTPRPPNQPFWTVQLKKKKQQKNFAFFLSVPMKKKWQDKQNEKDRAV